jgi:hypothetical protein
MVRGVFGRCSVFICVPFLDEWCMCRVVLAVFVFAPSFGRDPPETLGPSVWPAVKSSETSQATRSLAGDVCETEHTGSFRDA